ncbi:MAG: Smr/MutS family protein, partial [Proteiniphilum sp.]
AGDLERAMKEKRRADAPARRRVGHKPEKAPVVEIDLHINQLLDTTAGMDNAAILEYQLQKFNEAMKEHLPHKQRKLVFIHGKGDGVLRNAIVKELKKNYPSCYYQDASFQEYGYGATMVTIK